MPEVSVGYSNIRELVADIGHLLISLLSIIRRSLLLILLCGIVSAGISYSLYWYSTSYSAKSTILVKPAEDNTLDDSREWVKIYQSVFTFGKEDAVEKALSRLDLELELQEIVNSTNIFISETNEFLIEIEVENPNPKLVTELCYEITDALLNEFANHSNGIVGLEVVGKAENNIDTLIEPDLFGFSFPPPFQAGLWGIGLGLIFAIYIHSRDERIKINTNISEILGLNVLAYIGQMENNNDTNRIYQENMRNVSQAESYRMLRTNIRHPIEDNSSRTILITSSSPFEGKSTTAANLAIVMAQAGYKTILVDADLRRPVQHKIFGLDRTLGLTVALLQPELSIEQCLQKTEIGDLSNLAVLSSGPIPPNPSELLGSHQMQNLIRNLEQLADYVIIDTPPILIVTDSSLLAPFVGGVLLVLRANSTTVNTAQRALTQLHHVQARVLGCVLNDCVS